MRCRWCCSCGVTGMAIGRDASLLWIADEALLDEYDEEDTPLKVPMLRELPLSEDVCAYYSNIFRERSKPLRLDIGDETTSAKLAAHRHLEASRPWAATWQEQQAQQEKESKKGGSSGEGLTCARHGSPALPSDVPRR